MNTVIQISGREAIPIRAIPFVTGWMMSPDAVAKTFAHTDHWITKLDDVYAFSLSNDGSFVQTLPKEWDGIIAELEALSNMYQMDESYEGGNYNAWRRDSVPLLPPACFVWKDEFEKAFKIAYSEKKLILIDERSGERELNFSPMVPEKLESAVMQGFEVHHKEMNNLSHIDKPLMTKERESLYKMIIGMAVAGYRYDSKAARNDAIGDIYKDLEELGVNVDKDTIRKWLREAAQLLPQKPIKM